LRRRGADDGVMSDTRQLVIFSLAREEYALPITRVQEIIRYTQPRSVASSAPWIRGVINLRGKIVPVSDLAMRLASADSEYVDGVAKLDQRLPILLNPDGLLAGVSLAV
jgi:chemotaxis signal transduction protein